MPPQPGAPVPPGLATSPAPAPAAADAAVAEAAAAARAAEPDDASRARELVDGDWHRLHPATPLLRGGLALIAVAAILLNAFRDRLLSVVLPDEFSYENGGDAIDVAEDLASAGMLLWVLLGFVIVLTLCVIGFWLSWRVHRFRITSDVVEVRQGILFRQHRRAPLARVQGVNVQKPWFARLFGACRLRVQSAGADADVELSYLSTRVADSVRFEILARAAGRSANAGAEPRAAGGRIVDDFLRPDAEIADVAADSLVRVRLGTVVLSTLLDGGFLVGFVVALAVIVIAAVTGVPWLLVTVVPIGISTISFLVRTISRKARYSVAQTRDGIRLAYGLASTTTEVLPAGRVHSVEVSQPLLWRLAGWWKVTATRAGGSAGESAGPSSTDRGLLLPVGTRRDVEVVVELAMPGFGGTGLLAAALGDGDARFVTTPRSARALRPFSWRRNGIAIAGPVVVMRLGRIWRSMTVTPIARVQSFAIRQGPLAGAFGVAQVRVHTVQGTDPSVGALAAADATAVFEHLGAIVPEVMGADTSDVWRALDAVPAVSRASVERPSPAVADDAPDAATPAPPATVGHDAAPVVGRDGER